MQQEMNLLLFLSSQDPTFDKALQGMELLQQQLHSGGGEGSDPDAGVAGVGEEEEDDEDSMLGVRPLDLENVLEVCLTSLCSVLTMLHCTAYIYTT